VLFLNLAVEENIKFFGQAYGLRKVIDPGASMDKPEVLPQVFNFSEPMSQKCSKLSGGTVQKLNLILALLYNPDILLHDEPYSAFDWENCLSFWRYSERLRNDTE
jgi:ABC-type multidrug transport system ATPase subunit